MRDTNTERGRDTGRGRSRLHAEPDVGLNPGSPGSRSGLQAALNPCATGAALGGLSKGEVVCWIFGCRMGDGLEGARGEVLQLMETSQRWIGMAS